MDKSQRLLSIQERLANVEQKLYEVEAAMPKKIYQESEAKNARNVLIIPFLLVITILLVAMIIRG